MTSKGKDGRGPIALALIFGMCPDIMDHIEEFEEACGPIKFGEDDEERKEPYNGDGESL